MSTFLLVVSDVGKPTFLFFFDDHDLAISKYNQVTDYGDSRLYEICPDGKVMRIFPECDNREVVTLGRELMIPF